MYIYVYKHASAKVVYHAQVAIFSSCFFCNIPLPAFLHLPQITVANSTSPLVARNGCTPVSAVSALFPQQRAKANVLMVL